LVRDTSIIFADAADKLLAIVAFAADIRVAVKVDIVVGPAFKLLTLAVTADKVPGENRNILVPLLNVTKAY
jgi:hypothetical protein